MKKSETYKAAQMCVLRDSHICNVDKLEILRALMKEEDLALYTEKQKEKENANEAV